MTNVSCTVDHGGMPCPWDKPMPGVPEVNALLAEVEEALVAARYAALTDAVVLVTDREEWTINAPLPNYHWVARGRFAAAVLAALDGWTLVRVEDTRSLDIIREQDAATIATLRAALEAVVDGCGNFDCPEHLAIGRAALATAKEAGG